MIVNYRISIIIPCFNIAPHIEQCIDSVLAQSYPYFELLLINDGSKDDTLAICQKYEAIDNRIKVYTHPNNGVSYTRNRGIESATGEWLMFIDGDDYIKPDYIESLIAQCDHHVWPICGMIHVKEEEKTENENFHQLLERYPERIISKKDFLYLLKYNSYNSPCARLYERSVIIQHKISFPESITYQEDLIFNLEYSQCINQVRLVEYCGYYYVEHPTSSTRKYHQNFNHISRLYQELKIYVNSKADTEVLQEFILQTCLRNISNIFHINSPKTSNEKKEEIRQIFDHDYYQFSKGYINRLNINLLLKLILSSKNVSLTYLYFKLFHGK